MQSRDIESQSPPNPPGIDHGIVVRRTWWQKTVQAAVLLGLATCIRTQAAEWTLGFEEAEGFVASRAPSGAHVSVLGGDATILNGDAVEGEQFLRFVPRRAENALVINLDDSVADAAERTVSFAARLVGDPANTRLVISSGQTIALRPVGGGVEIEVPDRAVQRVSLPLEEGAWLRIGMRESPALGGWDLLLENIVVVEAIPLMDRSDLTSGVLIFADGALDLDAISATSDLTEGRTDPPADPEPRGGTDEGSGEPRGDMLTAEERAALLAQGYRDARVGKLAEADAAAEQLARQEEGSGRRELEIAQQLAMFAYALRDDGRYRAAAAVAYEALRHLEQARGMPFDSGDRAGRAAVDFFAGQLWEEVLIEPEQAERAYRDAAARDEVYASAAQRADRLAREREGPGDGEPGTGGGM